jgi:membrane fusion protein (multidrug efflux system)
MHKLFSKHMTSFKIANPLAIIGLGALLLQSCGNHEAKPLEPEAKAAETTATPTFVLEKGKLSSSLDMPGELISFQQVDLYAKVNSFVKKLNADVGTEVHTGQLLAIMEAPEITSQLSGAESRLKAQEAIYIASKANYNRLLETSKTPGTVSPNDLDFALSKQEADNAQLQAAKAAYREITDNRNYLEIRAPFDGVITARNVSLGAYVGPSGKGSEFPLFTLQAEKKLRLVVSVPELYSSYLSDKSEVGFTVRSLPGEKFTAQVKRLSGALDSRLRSQRIEMDVDNSSKKLLPGMVAEISIPLPARDSAFIVPKTAVVNSTQGVFVIKSLNGKAQWVSVKKGREIDTKTEVYGNLLVGDTLVESANEEVRDGAVL